MNIYEQNLKILADSYSGMDQIIENARDKMEKKIELKDEISYDERRILKIVKDGQSYYLNGRRNSIEPAQKWFSKLGDLQKNAPIFIEGVGNETYLCELAKQSKRSLAIIVYEPCLQIFIDFLKHIELKEMMEKHTIVFCVDGLEGMGKESLKIFIGRILMYEILPYARILITPNYDVLFPEQTIEFVKVCRDTAENGLIRFNTLKRFETFFVKNLFLNMRYLKDVYKTTHIPKVIPSDITGIVVAAGPSLNKNIHELKRAKGKAFIIATDTAVKPLIRAGIVPDMFVIVDAKKPLHLVKMEEARRIPLFTTADAASEILEYHEGMKFFANEGLKVVDRLFMHCDSEWGPGSDGGSVATAAFYLLFKIGMKTIILVGQDLAFTNNRSHADGTFEEKMPEKDTSRFPMIEGNNGDKVPSRQDFLIYLKWYNEFIEGCKKEHPYFRVINATEGGAKIAHTEVMTLNEAIDKECTKEVNIQECFQKLDPIFKGEDRKWVIEQLLNIPQECEKLSQEAMKTVKLYKNLDRICGKKILDQKAYVKILNKLRKQIKKIETYPVYQLVEFTLNDAQYIIKNEQMLSYDSVQEQGKEIARKGVIYMKNVSDCALVFKEYADGIFTKENIN